MSEKIKRNVGLSFDNETLPTLVFKGSGVYADLYEKEFKRIKPTSRVVKDQELVDKLYKLPITSGISPDLYELVAILLIYVYSSEIKIKGAKFG